jgi:hypothetical protein
VHGVYIPSVLVCQARHVCVSGNEMSERLPLLPCGMQVECMRACACVVCLGRVESIRAGVRACVDTDT